MRVSFVQKGGIRFASLLAGALIASSVGVNRASATPGASIVHSLVKNRARYVVQVKEAGSLGKRSMRLILRGKVSRLGRTLSGMDCAIVEATPSEVAKLRADNRILSVTLDRKVKSESILPPLDIDRAALGAEDVNGYTGYNGKASGNNVGVAVLDSGISTHPDLTGHIVGFKDFVNGRTLPYDDYGHGTHIAGLIAGSGSSGILSGAGRNYRGVAPRANLVGVKVLGALGEGRASDVIAGLDWCIANKNLYNIRVINLSLSSQAVSTAKTDPLCLAAERAINAGIVVVSSSGNFGGVYGTVGAPGMDPMVITVGASNTRGTASRTDDTITSFTGRGPTAYDLQIKPDIIAPGNDIVSLRVPGSTIDSVYPTQTRVSGTQYYSRLSGTSMSTALVSGTAAAMISTNDKLTPNAVKAALMFTAEVLSGHDPVTGKTTYFDPFTQGAGQLNAVGAVELASRLNANQGFVGHLPMSSFFNGQSVAWAGQTIPAILARPGLLWQSSLLWGGNTGKTEDEARSVWASNVVWGGSTNNPPPPHATEEESDTEWKDGMVWGDNVVWGGTTNNPPPPTVAEPEKEGYPMVYGNNVVWGGTTNNPPPPTYTGDPQPYVTANNVVWGGTTNNPPPPPRVYEDEEGTAVAGDSQLWGGWGMGLLCPDPITGPLF